MSIFSLHEPSYRAAKDIMRKEPTISGALLPLIMACRVLPSIRWHDKIDILLATMELNEVEDL